MTKKVPGRATAARWAVFAITAIGVLYLIGAAAVLDLALTPKRAECSPPDGVAAQPLDFSSADEEHIPLKGWIMTSPLYQGSARAVVLVHGLDSCGWAGMHRDLAKEYLRKGFTVVVFDLRAQGRSGGTHLGLGWKERADVQAAVQQLRLRGFSADKIGLHGTSFGAGTVLLAAAMIPDIGAVVSDSAFADVRDLMSAELDRKVGAGWLFTPGVRLIARLRYGFDVAEIPPIVAVPKIAPRPILFLHGTADRRIPAAHARRLRAVSLGKDDELWLLEGAGHTQGLSFNREQYLSRTTGFMAAHL